MALPPAIHNIVSELRLRLISSTFDGDFASALKDVEGLLRVHPDQAALLNLKGVILEFWSACRDLHTKPFESGFLRERALQCYEQALSVDPHSVDAVTNIGDHWRDKGNLDRAITWYDQAIAMLDAGRATEEPQDSYHDVYHSKLWALRDAGETERAEECRREAVLKLPDDECFQSGG